MAVTYFGSSTATGSGAKISLDPNTAWTQVYSAPSSGYVTVGRFWAKNTSGASNIRMLAYTDSSSAPSALLGVSNAVNVPIAAVITEYDVTFPTPFYVNSSQTIWLGSIGDVVLLNAYDNAGLNTQYDYTATNATYPNPPNPFGTPSTLQAVRNAAQLGIDSSYVPPAYQSDVAPIIVAANIF